MVKLSNLSIKQGNFIDIFTISHLLSGVWVSIFLELYITKKNIFLWGSLAHFIYEIKDFCAYYEIIKTPEFLKIIWGKSGGLGSRNSFKNSIGDQVSYSFGYLIYKFLKEKCKIKFTTKLFVIIFILCNILYLILIYNF